jgi:hypothetical protein
MEITLNIPDEVVPDLQNGITKPLSRRALELLALDGYKAGTLTEYQVQLILGFDDRFEVDAFLKENGVHYDYTVQDLERDSAAMQSMDVPLQNEKFIGMWRDREEMTDSSAWVRKVRESEWGQ